MICLLEICFLHVSIVNYNHNEYLKHFNYYAPLLLAPGFIVFFPYSFQDAKNDVAGEYTCQHSIFIYNMVEEH